MGGTRTTVFGLDVRAAVPLPLLAGARAAATGRSLDVCEHPGGLPALAALDGFELISDQLQPDGAVSYRIEAHAEMGYLLWGPDYGAYLLSPDGRWLQYGSGDAPQEAWQRLLIAQVLPWAALLRGLEVLHASAVVIDGLAVAFAGPSRSGKTSLALELCSRGAGFLADDVLALQCAGSELVGHPGSPVAGLDREEARRIPQRLATTETVAENDRELLVRVQAAGAPAPLAAIFFLDRRVDGPARPRFEPIADPRVLLAATFNFVLANPRRLRGLLDVCALAARRRVERVLIGPSVDASQLATAVTRRLAGAP